MTAGSLLQKITYYLLKLAGKQGGMILKRSVAMNSQSHASFYDLKINSIDAGIIHFNSFRGKKVLLVNTASECGYTGQYADLEKLFKEQKDKLVVIGFPSNDFGKQEPGSNKEIQVFCTENYAVTFPITEKINVTGPGIHPVYQWLSQSTLNGWNDKSPGWNFCKYLVDEKGELLSFYSEKINPLDSAIIKELN